MKHVICRLAVALMAFFLCVPEGRAQDDSIRIIPSPEERPDLYVMLQDSSDLYLVSEDGDTADPNFVSSSFMFDILYDSTCTTSYLLTEWRHNNRLLFLPTWINKRIVNARASLLSYNTRTDTFICAPGDTLSFYRELMWYNPQSGLQDTNNYYALDSLDFAVELVRGTDSTRAALIDSIGILPNELPGRPRIHGTRPLMDLVQYVVPAELAGTPVFMRLLLYHRGSGRYWFTRHDGGTIEVSKRLQDSSFMYYIGLFGHGSPLYKTQILETFGERTRRTPHLDVRFSPTQPFHAIISCASAISGATTIGIYDVNGRVIFYPYTTPAASGIQTVEYVFPQSGNYFIGLLHNGQLVATRKVSVAQ